MVWACDDTCEEPTSTPTPTPEPSNGDDGGDGSPGEAPVCGAAVPGAPTLLSVTPSTSVDLVWTAVSSATHYTIVYGPGSGNYIHGVPNTGNVTSFNVGGVGTGAGYCFAVRAVNDCAPGDLSNEICVGGVLGAATGQVLGATTLAETGSSTDELFQIFFIIGCGCLSLGLRNYTVAKVSSRRKA